MFTTEAGQPPEPFTINVNQSVSDDLVARRKDDRYGLSTSYLDRLVTHWADEFDWRTIDGNINSFHWTCTPSAVMCSSRGGLAAESATVDRSGRTPSSCGRWVYL